MLGAGGTCEFTALSEYRRPASTSVTGFCACPRPAAPPVWNPMRRRTERGAAHAPRAGLWEQAQAGCRSAADMQRAEAGRAEANVRRRGTGSPSRRGAPCIPQVENLRPLSESFGHWRRGTGSPERRDHARLSGAPPPGRARARARRSARAGSQPRRCRARARRGGGRRVCRGRGRRPRAPRPR